MGSIGESDGTSDVHLQKLLEVDTDHLYRHLTEVNGKDTRVSKLAVQSKRLTIVFSFRAATLRGNWNLILSSSILPLVLRLLW